MAILVTGGTGKTGSRIVQKLQAAGLSVYVASRSGKAPEHGKGVRFDWSDTTTHETPFATAAAAGETITAIYIVCPQSWDTPRDMFNIVKPVIDLAKNKGVKRFVLMSASAVASGDAPHGLLHEYLDKIGVDYCTLRPSYFMENFSESYLKFPLITEGVIRSAAADGKIPFVSAEDIADAAFHALTDEKIACRDLLIGGPELLTFSDLAATFSEVLGRPIKFQRYTKDEYAQVLKSQGLPPALSEFLSTMDETFAAGVEEERFNAQNKFTGRQTFKEFVQANREVWQQN